MRLGTGQDDVILIDGRSIDLGSSDWRESDVKVWPGSGRIGLVENSGSGHDRGGIDLLLGHRCSTINGPATGHESDHRVGRALTIGENVTEESLSQINWSFLKLDRHEGSLGIRDLNGNLVISIHNGANVDGHSAKVGVTDPDAVETHIDDSVCLGRNHFSGDVATCLLSGHGVLIRIGPGSREELNPEAFTICTRTQEVTEGGVVQLDRNLFENQLVSITVKQEELRSGIEYGLRQNSR